MKTQIRILMALLLCLMACKTPELDYKSLSNKVRVSADSTSVYAVLSPDALHHLKKDSYYSWYDKGIIGSTQGGYSGKLLDGQFTSWYSANKQLKMQGNYQMGLKDGIWMKWTAEGKMLERQKWKKGVMYVPKVRKSWKSRLFGFPKKIGMLFKAKKRDSV